MGRGCADPARPAHPSDPGHTTEVPSGGRTPAGDRSPVMDVVQNIDEPSRCRGSVRSAGPGLRPGADDRQRGGNLSARRTGGRTFSECADWVHGSTAAGEQSRGGGAAHVPCPAAHRRATVGRSQCPWEPPKGLSRPVQAAPEAHSGRCEGPDTGRGRPVAHAGFGGPVVLAPTGCGGRRTYGRVTARANAWWRRIRGCSAVRTAGATVHTQHPSGPRTRATVAGRPWRRVAMYLRPVATPDGERPRSYARWPRLDGQWQRTYARWRRTPSSLTFVAKPRRRARQPR